MVQEQSCVDNLPHHIGIIMDGNGRWALKKGLPRYLGHRRAVNAVRAIIEECCRLNIGVLSLYAFSMENWKRPKEEIDKLMDYLVEFLEKEQVSLRKNNIKLVVSGRINLLADFVREKLDEVIKDTSENSGLLLNLCLSYGGRQEIIDACQSILDELWRQKRYIVVDEDIFSKHLYNPQLPDVDLLIRTSGEVRISNFLLWQIAYAEIYISPRFWPDFDVRELHKAIKSYQNRERRFGAISK